MPITTLWAQSQVDTSAIREIHATYYSDKFVGRKTASGEVFSQKAYTAAHKTLPFGTLLLVTNPKNGAQVIVKINDRCPKQGILDLSKTAARQIGISSSRVQYKVLTSQYVSIWAKQKPGRTLELVDDSVHVNTLAPASPEAPSLRVSATPARQYMIVVAEVSNRAKADSLIERLPLKYRNEAEQVRSKTAGRITVRLSSLRNEREAKAVIKDLQQWFPLCRLQEGE